MFIFCIPVCHVVISWFERTYRLERCHGNCKMLSNGEHGARLLWSWKQRRRRARRGKTLETICKYKLTTTCNLRIRMHAYLYFLYLAIKSLAFNHDSPWFVILFSARLKMLFPHEKFFHSVCLLFQLCIYYKDVMFHLNAIYFTWLYIIFLDV